MDRERFTPRDKKARQTTRDAQTGRGAPSSKEQLVGNPIERDFDLRKPQQDHHLAPDLPVSVHDTIVGRNHSVYVRQEQNSSQDSFRQSENFRADAASHVQNATKTPIRHAPSFEGASERQSVSETNRAPRSPAYQNRFTKPAQDTVPVPDVPTDSVRIADEAKSSEFVEPAADTPFPERPGRLRFDDTSRPDFGSTQSDTAGAEASASAPPHSDKSSDSSVPPKKSRLNFTADETPPADTPPGKKLTKAHAKADKTAAKLEKAQEKLPTHRRVRVKKETDASTGKPVRKFTFEKEVKSQRAHVKGSLPLRPVKAGANAAIAYGHKRIHEIEHENVGTEAAHKGELAAEGALRHGYRSHKTRPYSRVAKLQHKSAKHAVNASYQQALHDNPKLKSNIISRAVQKQKIKRQYAQAAREARRAGKAAIKVGEATATAGKKVVSFVKRHPVIFGIIALILLLMMLIMGVFTSCSNMAAGGFSSVLASSYLAEEADIDNAELVYTEWETDLQIRINRAESDFPGYNEYRYSVDDIGHNPYELMAFLTAAYQNFTYAQVSGLLSEMFAEQYNLALTPETEIRTRTETRSDTYTDPDTGETYTETYEVEVEYEWYILNITLTARSFTDVAVPRLDSDQREIYELLIRSKGNRQYLSNVFGFNWLPYVSSYYGWRVHPISGEKNYYMGIDIAVAQGTPILAGHDGVVTDVGYDAGGYGNYVVITGDAGLVSIHAHCETVSVSAGQKVKVGDTIATVGSTGNSTGAHLHLEIIKNDRYLNPIFFAQTGDDGSSCLLPGSPGGVVFPSYSGEPMGDGSYAALLAEAQRYIGYPYVWGGSSPSSSFDCSGYICWIINQSGVGSVGRTTAQGLYNICTPVSLTDAKPGDLLFFHSTYSTTDTVTHVALYLGGDTFIHCGNPIGYASLSSNYWQQHFYAAGRLAA